MKGDFTRDTFDRSKHYSRVRMQQGRVQIDADWNEQIDILMDLDRITRQDVIGYCGGPQGEDNEGNALAGFRVVDRDGKFILTGGRYYVAGILCQNEKDVPLTGQPHQFDFVVPEAAGQEGLFLAYLDVWERHITALEDPDIREVALGGPDTATRTQTIWQVKVEPVDDGATCNTFGSDWVPPGTASTGRLAARAEPGADSDELCLTPAGAGYRRLENQLYRVEIHTGGGIGEATFKWSRENGSVVTRWSDQDGDTLRVSSSGRDSYLGFAAGDWVELSDETRDLNGVPGILVQLAAVEGQLLTIDPATIVDPDDPNANSVAIDQFPFNPKVRRWDILNGPEMVSVPAGNGGWLPLEDGVEIRFDPAGIYQTGDYWLIPARTALGDILWPAGNPSFQERLGIKHYYCPLALIAAEGVVGRALVTASGDPDLAESFEPSEDGLDWTFNLWEGLSHPDGTPIIAGVFSEILNKTQDLLTNFDNAVVIDDLTLRIALTQLADEGLFFQELSEVRIDVTSQGPQVTDCRSLFPPLTQLGETDGRPEAAIHIDTLQLTNGEQLIHDSNVSVELFALGLNIFCDAAIDPNSVTGKPTCFVTLDMPIPFNDVDREMWGGEVIGFRPLKLAAEVVAADNVLKWIPIDPTGAWLQERLFEILVDTGVERVLAHLTLKGNFIWSDTAPLLYLDGEAFGAPQPTDHNLLLPSGNGRRGGDFEMWFWLVR